MSSNSNPFSIIVAPPGDPVFTALADACRSLAPGDTIAFTPQPMSSTTQGLDWQISWYYDQAHKRAHLLYKAANNNISWAHRVYDETAQSGAGEWYDGGLVGSEIDKAGHIYGNHTLDPATGDLYLQVWNESFLRRWTAATGQWDFFTSAFGESFSYPINGIVWHPNLYGPGDGGIVWTSNFGTSSVRMRSWRKSTDTWNDLGTVAREGAGDKHGGGSYFAAIDKVVTGFCETKITHVANPVILVSPGNPPTLQATTPPPASVATGTFSNSREKASLVQHPRDPTKLMMIQKDAPDPYGGNATWTTTDGDTWLDGPAHPFNPARITCSIPENANGDYGVIWNISADESTLWKPPL